MAPAPCTLDYDRKAELIAFDETKTGVKGLVDAGIDKVPRIFHMQSPPENLPSNQPPEKLQSNQAFDDLESKQPSAEDVQPNQPAELSELSLPTIDLEGINEDPIRRKKVIEEMKDALGSWGFFQLVNHGIPIGMMDDMRKGVLGFYEQDTEVKKQWYTRDIMKHRLVYNSNFDLYSAPVANWRDSFMCFMSPNPPKPDELPTPCSDILLEYSSLVKKLGCGILKLMSEALGLDRNHLLDIGCSEVVTLAGHYYPPCPQPELTIGTLEHTDGGFITILQQDHIGGLKVFHQNQWIDVPPITGALVVNGGDLLQLLTNDNFVSARHKVVSSKVGPRVSVASFFMANLAHTSKHLEPIKELTSKDIPPKYRGTTTKEFMEYFQKKGLGGASALSHFKI